jgi:threonine/homoserine/homoserine lactone efflux protein
MVVAVTTFALAAVLIVLLPGPDTLVVVRNIIRGGRRMGALTAFGNLCGLVVWVAVAALGLTAALKASEVGFDALRIAGALYLAWLGIQAIRSRGAEPAPTQGRRGLLGSGYLAGLLTNLLNPKVGVFFIAFLPGFVPDGVAIGAATALFGAIFVAITAAYWVVLLRLAPKVTRWMNTPRVRRRLDLVTGAMLIGFGARLATE